MRVMYATHGCVCMQMSCRYVDVGRVKRDLPEDLRFSPEYLPRVFLQSIEERGFVMTQY